MADLLETRLQGLYPHLNDSPEFRAEVSTALARNVLSIDADVRNQSPDDVESKSSWPIWLKTFRSTLNELVSAYGLPGGGFCRDVEVRNNDATWKALGADPRN